MRLACGKPIEKLAAGGMAEEGIGEGTIFLSAHPSDEIEHHTAGPVARVLHRRVLDDASALIPPRWERMLVEDRRDDEEAKPVRDWARIVAIAAGVPRDAVKDHEQRRIGTSRGAVGEDHHTRAVDIDDLSAGRDRRSHGRRGPEQVIQHCCDREIPRLHHCVIAASRSLQDVRRTDMILG